MAAASKTGRSSKRPGALLPWAASGSLHAAVMLTVTVFHAALVPAEEYLWIDPQDAAKRAEADCPPDRRVDLYTRIQIPWHAPTLVRPQWSYWRLPPDRCTESDNSTKRTSPDGAEDAISDLPLGDVNVCGSCGAGPCGLAGVFGYRDGNRRKAVARFGGSEATENAVEAALKWLARQQEENGGWDAPECEGRDAAAAGLALQAFLSAGYTHRGRHPEWRADGNAFGGTVARGLGWLLSHQREDGRIGQGADEGPHLIAALALVEAYGMTKDPALREPAQKAVDCATRPREDNADASRLAWRVVLVRSARTAGLPVNAHDYHRLWRRAWYLPKSGNEEPLAVAARAACRHFTAPGSTFPLPNGMLLTVKPEWPQRDLRAWHWATLASMQLGGQGWEGWKKALSSALVANQRRGGLGDLAGSWDPAKGSGLDRVSATALGALCLEVYYRYLPRYCHRP